MRGRTGHLDLGSKSLDQLSSSGMGIGRKNASLNTNTTSIAHLLILHERLLGHSCVTKLIERTGLKGTCPYSKKVFLFVCFFDLFCLDGSGILGANKMEQYG